MLLTNITEEKNKINHIIANSLNEILAKNSKIDSVKFEDYLDDIIFLMDHLRQKNRIYDYAIDFKNELDIFGKINGKIAYTLIDSTDNKYQDLLEFRI